MKSARRDVTRAEDEEDEMYSSSSSSSSTDIGTPDEDSQGNKDEIGQVQEIETNFEEGDLESAADKIIRIAQKSYDISQEFAERMKGLNVKISWDVGEILKKSEKGVYGTRYKDAPLGRLSDEEKAYLTNRLLKFCKKNNLQPEEVKLVSGSKPYKFKMSNEMRLKFLQYLGKDLKERTPRTVVGYLSRLGLRKGKYTTVEDNLLADVYQTYAGPDLYSLCGLLLNRERQSIYGRFRRLKQLRNLGSRAKKAETPQSHEERSEAVLFSFLKRAKKHGRVKGNIITYWKAIGEENSMSPALAKAIFLCDLQPRLNSDGHFIGYHRLCSDIIATMCESWRSWDEVPWRAIARTLAVTDLLVYFLYRQLVETHVPSEKWENFSACQEELTHRVLPLLQGKIKNDKEYYMQRIEVVL